MKNSDIITKICLEIERIKTLITMSNLDEEADWIMIRLDILETKIKDLQLNSNLVTLLEAMCHDEIYETVEDENLRNRLLANQYLCWRHIFSEQLENNKNDEQ